jgi:uncharacterized membrane protein
MSEEDRKEELPEVPPAGEPPAVPPDEELGQQLTDQAESVTSETQDLSDELTPPAEVAPDEEPIWAPTDAVVPGPVAPAVAPEGAPLSGPEAVPAPLTTVTPATEQARGGSTFTPEGTDDDRLLSALAWFTMVILQLPIVSIIQLLSPTTKDRPFQRHHAITSLMFYAAAFVYELVAAVVYIVLSLVTLGCGFACLWVLFFVPHILALYYAFQAYSGKRIRLPGLTDFAKQQGWL